MSPAPVKGSAPSILSQINEVKSQINRTQLLWLITFGVVLLTLLIGVALIQLPWQERRRSLAAQYAEEKERSELLLGIKRQKTELQDIESKYLMTGGATGLASQVSNLASQSGLQIDSVTPQPEVSVEPYTRFQIEIIAMGDLATALRFLHTVEEHRPLLWVEQLDMGELPDTAGFAREEDMNLETTGRQKVRVMLGAISRQTAGE